MKNFKHIFLLKLSSYIVFSFLIILSSCDEEDPVLGCMDSTACNFDQNATEDDDSCEYAQQNFDCNGNCTIEADCAGTCGGLAVNDCAGTCDGTSTFDCDDVCYNPEAGELPTKVVDCLGDCGGSAVFDVCDVCDGDGLNSDGCCGDDFPGCSGVCGQSYIDCTDNCCQPLVNSECLDILVNNTQITFCEENFSDDENLQNECKNLVVTTLDAFCELHFGCASIDCLGECSGGSTALPNYEICGCFESDAENYWCNSDDGGECPVEGTSIPSQDALDCQEECIVGILGSFIAVNPYIYDTGYTVYNDLESCDFEGCTDEDALNYDPNATILCADCCEYHSYGCMDPNAANYDGTVDIDDGTCQHTNYFKIGNVTDATIEILVENDIEIWGFEFNVTSLTITGASGGLAEENGFEVSTGETNILGFSFTGSTVPLNSSEMLLTSINYSNIEESSLCIEQDFTIAGEPIDDDDNGIPEGVIDLTSDFIIHHESACP